MKAPTLRFRLSRAFPTICGLPRAPDTMSTTLVARVPGSLTKQGSEYTWVDADSVAEDVSINIIATYGQAILELHLSNQCRVKLPVFDLCIGGSCFDVSVKLTDVAVIRIEDYQLSTHCQSKTPKFWNWMWQSSLTAHWNPSSTENLVFESRLTKVVDEEVSNRLAAYFCRLSGGRCRSSQAIHQAIRLLPLSSMMLFN
uniref:CS domain-containing protein n=1 Tax=Panagrellus redivivus TaxID=6233 RepID=A0A7E4UY93_PANRE